MQDQLVMVWQRVMGDFADRVESKVHAMVAQRTVLTELTPERVTVGCDSNFTAEILEESTQALRRCLRETVGVDPVDLRFKVEPTLFRRRRAREKSDAAREVAAGARAESEPRGRRAIEQDREPGEIVVGAANRLAWMACAEAAETPGSAFNPIFVHGGTGLGKTQMLRTVTARMRRRHPALRVLGASGERFVNEFVYALSRRRVQAFREKWRGLDALVMDDVQIFAGKSSSEEEFLHTLDDLMARGAQLVLSADAPPQSLSLRTALVNRFQQGMVARLDPPDHEQRIRILHAKLAERGADCPEHVLDLIADRCDGSVRELEGALSRVTAYARLTGCGVDRRLALEALGGMHASSVRTDGPVTLDHICRAVAEHFEVALTELCGRKRTKSLNRPRQVAYHLARQLTDASASEIGRWFGDRNHGTVVSGCRRLERDMETDESLARTVARLRARLGR